MCSDTFSKGSFPRTSSLAIHTKHACYIAHASSIEPVGTSWLRFSWGERCWGIRLVCAHARMCTTHLPHRIGSQSSRMCIQLKCQLCTVITPRTNGHHYFYSCQHLHIACCRCWAAINIVIDALRINTSVFACQRKMQNRSPIWSRSQGADSETIGVVMEKDSVVYSIAHTHKATPSISATNAHDIGVRSPGTTERGRVGIGASHSLRAQTIPKEGDYQQSK